ncbi:NUDIX domain-containing protein [Halapricum salinum]|uniref:NUDIX domain-containing protein n=1 Tax=Halapricum salinum TaxID=1457250 RepID=A0A4D6HEI9_9EURY|nr:NUDIX domain-containing protein [Halapricum salinum]QCC52200.1 NUDIX domain-containing protein [Halapricum salinum]
MSPYLSDETWETVVRSVPLVSVDLVVHYDGGVILGKRTNEPAKGEWFVPGGTVRKHESLEDAVQRVANEELGVGVTIERRLGVYEHVYDVADIEDAGGKHYVPIGFEVRAESDSLDPDDQHADLQVFEPPFEIDLHPYVRQYLEDAGVMEN